MLQLTVNILTVWIQGMPDTTKPNSLFTSYFIVCSEYFNCLDPARNQKEKVRHSLYFEFTVIKLSCLHLETACNNSNINNNDNFYVPNLDTKLEACAC